MTFDINTSTTLSFTGEKYIHAWLEHEFQAETLNSKFTLDLRARQFSSYIVLLGRIISPTQFDPSHAIIVSIFSFLPFLFFPSFLLPPSPFLLFLPPFSLLPHSSFSFLPSPSLLPHSSFSFLPLPPFPPQIFLFCLILLLLSPPPPLFCAAIYSPCLFSPAAYFSLFFHRSTSISSTVYSLPFSPFFRSSILSFL